MDLGKKQFAASTKKFLMLGIVERALSHVIVQEVPRIKSAAKIEPESALDMSVRIGTDGVNLAGMWDYADELKLETLQSNNIYEILTTYGVEAARATVMREIYNVFNVYGIGVDTRHLSLIADYMTFEGEYKPFNRMGLASNVAPFAKMSFETTMHFMTDAALYFFFVSSLLLFFVHALLQKPVSATYTFSDATFSCSSPIEMRNKIYCGIHLPG